MILPTRRSSNGSFLPVPPPDVVSLAAMTARHRTQAPRPRGALGLLSSCWHLLFAVNDKFVTYQQRRNWRARAAFFLVAGVLLTLGVQATLGKHLSLCPR